jgi:hypothetical protein
MNDQPPEYLFFIALAAGVAVVTLLSGSPFAYLNFLLLLLLGAILAVTRSWPDRGFYLACGGVPLVIACSIMNLWAGLFAVCMLGGMVAGALGLLTSREDLRPFACFCAGSSFVALLIQLSNHVLLPLLVIGGLTVLIIAIQSIRMYQFKKHYTGA